MSVAELTDPLDNADAKPLLACRGCLAACRPLRPLERTLAALYGELVPTNVQQADILPKFVCSYCHVLLFKFKAFRDSCQNSQATFLNLQSAGIPITLDLLESGVAGAPYPNLIKTSVELLNFDGNLDKKLDVHNIPSNIWVSIEKEQWGHSGHSNNELWTNDYKSEPTNSGSVEEEYVGLSAGNAEDVKDDVDNDCRDSDDSDEDRDAPDCLAGFSSDIYKKDTKKPFKDELSTASKKIKNKKEPKVKITKRNIAIDTLMEDVDMALLTEATDLSDDSDDQCLAGTSRKLAKDRKNAITKTISKKKSQQRRATKKALKTPKDSDLSLNGIIQWLDDIKAKKFVEKRAAAAMAKKANSDLSDPTLSFSACILESHKRLYEKKYNFKVILLTKEEQMQRIKARKDAPGYKNANFKCEYCYHTFITNITFKNHMAKHDASYGDLTCDVCKMRYPTQGRLKNHFKSFHLYEYICVQCDKVCKSSAEAFNHYTSHKGITYDCKICGKSFKIQTSLVGHMHLSHGGTVECKICYGKFMGNNGLKIHMHLSHKEAIDAVCKDCGVQFHSGDALQRHLAAGDHSHRPCAECGDSFLNDQLLRQHQQEKHKIDFDCEICGRKCGTWYKFRSHMQNHNPDYKEKQKRHAKKQSTEGGPFICEICGASKTNKQNLRLHMNIHTRPFVCSYCDRRFSVKLSLKSHIACKHKDKLTSPPPASAEYACQYCDKRFNHFGNRWRHENYVHLKKRPFTCTCGATYQEKHALQMHINTKHLGLPWPKRDRRPRQQARGHAED